VRAVFLFLLSANLLFLAWAQWVDSPRQAPAEDAFARLPRLQLVTDSPAGHKPAVFESTPPDSLRALPQRTSLRSSSESAQACTSIGPFNDIASAARAAGLLVQRGFSLSQRAEEGETIEGYWVFVGGMNSDEEVTRVVDRLDKSGFTDAHVMRNYSSTNRRVSVGMFTTQERAEKRAAAVKNMGLQPEIGERKFPGTVYWVDVLLQRGSGVKQLPPEYSFADIGHSKVQMVACPPKLRPTEPEAAPDDEGDRVPWRLPRTTVASAPPKH
jgi:hypothetical protein